MEQSDQSKKVFQLDWVSVLIILAFASGCIYFGVRTSKLSKKDEANIAAQAVLQAQRDSTKVIADRMAARVKILEVEVGEANKNTADVEKQLMSYRKKYQELSSLPAIHDTVVVEECELLVERYDNYVTILKANILSYSKLTDTLQLENKYLKDAYSLSVALANKQKDDLTKARGQVRRHKIANWGLGGALGGAIIVLLLK